MIDKNLRGYLPDEYLAEWCEDLEDEIAYEMDLFMKYEWDHS